jgi:hypothetical protein
MPLLEKGKFLILHIQLVAKFLFFVLFMQSDHNRLNKLQSYSLPSDKHIDLTLGASGSTYTAPANGYYQCYIGGPSGDKWLRLHTSVGYLQEAGFSTSNNIGFTIPIQKGQIFDVKYSGTLTVSGLRFIYAQGSAPQT